MLRITDSLYIPEDLLALKGRLIVHVSDTPSTFYRDMRYLVAKLAPVALIHTGDVADDVKLGLCPRLLPWYARKLADLSGALCSLPSDAALFVAGNHDDVASIRRVFSDSPVIEGSATIVLHGLEIGLSHDLQGLPIPPARFNLYGHDDSRPDSNESGHLFLNGLLGVNCIDVATEDVYSISYPAYVERDRSRIRKCGL